MAHYLGIDVGTTKIAAMVLEAATGRPVAVETRANTSRLPAPASRGAWEASEWDADQAVDLCLAAARSAIAQVPAIAIQAIGITGQMHGMLLVDQATGRPLTPFIGWQDKRCDAPLGDFPSALAWWRHLADADAPRRTGCHIATGFMGATLFWLTQMGQLPPAPVTASFLPDYFVARLCEQPPTTDPTNAASAGLLNLTEGRWDGQLLAGLGLPPQLLPIIHPTGSIAGTLSAEAAAALALPAGLPVLNALGDNQASFFGSVAHADDDLLVNIGTGGQISATTGQTVPPGNLETRPFLAEQFLLVGAGVTGGNAYALLNEFIGQIGEQVFNVVIDKDALYGVLHRLAASVPAGSDGLQCEPIFAGTRRQPQQRGRYSGIARRTFTPGHLARALLEGMAETFLALYGEMQTNGLRQRSRLIGSGNCIRRNPLLATILSQRFGIPLATPQHTEEAAFGAALLASVATGEHSVTSAGDLIQYLTVADTLARER